MLRSSRGPALVALLLVLAAGPAAADAGLRGQLAALAERHGFRIAGLGRIGGEGPVPVSAPDLPGTLEELLEGYNHAVVRDGKGGVKSVHVYSRITRAPLRNVVDTRREGLHHLVDSEVVGPRGARERVSLVIDTGATTVVLPVSMIPRLGFRAEDLADGIAQTGNGTVPSRGGVLRSLTLGRSVVRDVAVSFLPDAGLGGRKLLGMEVLNRYRVVIDDANNRITLLPR